MEATLAAWKLPVFNWEESMIGFLILVLRLIQLIASVYYVASDIVLIGCQHYRLVV